MTLRRVLNGIGKALKVVVMGGFGGCLLVTGIAAFVMLGTVGFALACCLLLGIALGISLLAFAVFSGYDLVQGNTDFSWFSLQDGIRKPKPPPSDAVETPRDLPLPPKTRESSPPPVFELATPVSTDQGNETMSILPDQTEVLEPLLRKWT